MRKLQIVIAGIPETNERLSRIFSDCDVVLVETMNEAMKVLARRYDALLIAVRFDESRMFDLLRYVRETETRHVPIICYRSTPGPVTSTALALHAIKLACQALGADRFFDLESYPDEEEGNRAIRKLIGELAASEAI